MEAEDKRQDELKHQAEAAKEAERKAKYELALAREEERKMVSMGLGVDNPLDYGMMLARSWLGAQEVDLACDVGGETASYSAAQHGMHAYSLSICYVACMLSLLLRCGLLLAEHPRARQQQGAHAGDGEC
jgi:hypothetical protein